MSAQVSRVVALILGFQALGYSLPAKAEAQELALANLRWSQVKSAEEMRHYEECMRIRSALLDLNDNSTRELPLSWLGC